MRRPKAKPESDGKRKPLVVKDKICSTNQTKSEHVQQMSMPISIKYTKSTNSICKSLFAEGEKRISLIVVLHVYNK